MKDSIHHDLITKDEIMEILIKYAIGRKPLAKLLGWGEATIFRYLSGDIPSIAYSERLNDLRLNQSAYQKLLIENHRNITDFAYQKSLSALYDHVIASRLYAAAYYLKNRMEGMSSLEGIRILLYFSQGFHLAMYGEQIFPEEFKLTESKIPYVELDRELSNYFTVPNEQLETVLSFRQRTVLDGIINAFCWYGVAAIQTIMYQETTQLHISRNKQNERIISKDTLIAHFQYIRKEYYILKPDDIWKYIDIKFAEIRNWQTMLPW